MTKTKIVILLAAAGLLSGQLFAADSKAASGQVDITFDKPENFTDVKDSYMDSEKGRDSILAEFKTYVEEYAPKFLGPGMKLAVTFTDIDMAGDFEPWRGPSAQDVRIVKAIYIPRIKLTYRVTDAGGAVVKEGKSELTDLNFQSNINPMSNSDRLHYEKRLLNDWLRSEFRSLAKK